MAVDLFLCFLMYIVSVVNPTFTMILNQMMDILWQTAAAVSNSATRRAWTFKLKFFEMGNTTYNGNALFAEMSYLNYITYVMKIRSLSPEASTDKLLVVDVSTIILPTSLFPRQLGNSTAWNSTLECLYLISENTVNYKGFY